MNVIHRCGCPIDRLHSFGNGMPLYVNALNCEIDTGRWNAAPSGMPHD